MPSTAELRDRLEALADHPSPRSDEDLLDAARRAAEQGRRPPRRALAVAAAVLVVGVALGTTAWLASGDDAPTVATTTPTSVPAPDDLGTPRWDALPPGPGPLSTQVLLLPDGAFGWISATGSGEVANGALTLGGAAYDDDTGTWTSVDRPQQLRAVPRQHGDPATIWTGTEVLLVVPTWSGADAAVGDLTTLRWRPGDPAARLAGTATIAGTARPEPNLQVRLTVDDGAVLALVTQFGVAGDLDPSYQAVHQLWRYELASSTWMRLEDPPATSDRIYGFEATPAGVLLTSATPPPEGAAMNAYGPILVDRRAPDGTWSRSVPGPEALTGQSAGAAWDGRRLVVVSYAPSAAAYDPVSDTWTQLAEPPIGGCEDYPSVVRTATQVVTGYCGRFAALRDGDAAWTPLPDPPERLSWLRDADASRALGIRWASEDERDPQLVVLRRG